MYMDVHTNKLMPYRPLETIYPKLEPL